MWISIYPWADRTLAQLGRELEDMGFKSNLADVPEPLHMDELCVELMPDDIFKLRKVYDVMILDRHGKDYIYLDTKNRQFRSR